MNRKFLAALSYIDYSENELHQYEEAQASVSIDLKEKKKSLKGKIISKNILKMDKYISEGLNKDEKIVDTFRASATTLYFFANMNSYDYKYIPYMFRDIGQYFSVYLTNEKLIIIETNESIKLKRETFFDLDDILSFVYKKRIYGYKFVFKFKDEDKYRFREAFFMNTAYFKYYYRMKVTDKRAMDIAKLLDNAINKWKSQNSETIPSNNN